MITQADDYPLHQTANPIAFAGTDRNFYDRFFFKRRCPMLRQLPQWIKKRWWNYGS